jgi:hypothetical protein
MLMAMSKEQRKEQSFRAWIDQNREGLILIMKAEERGFDVKAVLRDALKDQTKDREHYRIRKESDA